MKLVIQIPCLYEAEHLPAALADLPRSIDGVDKLLVQVIDDGSTDATSEVARKHGANHVVHLNRHRGLAQAFIAGIHHALKLGAGIIVNTDADRPYKGEDIARLLKPIVEKKADVVVGCRNFDNVKHFTGFLADLVAANRLLAEESLYHARAQTYSKP